jgi:serine/threonine-protein kinase
MAQVEHDRNLLFGVLALQNGLIDQARFVAAFQAWTLAPDRSLAEHLGACGALSQDDRAAVEALVTCHLKRHGGNAEESLAVIPNGRSIRQQLDRLHDSKLDDFLLCRDSQSDSTERNGPEPSLFATLDPRAGHPGSDTNIDRASILARIGAEAGPLSPVHLAGSDSEAGKAAPGENVVSGTAGRYPILGEIAHGGMGVVLKGRDPDLGRELALKVLRDHHRHRPDLVHRFIEEAQICGQLQHPGIVPIYELGMLSDHRPFFTMKLVKGQTLAKLLGERGRVSASRPQSSAPGADATQSSAPGANATGLALSALTGEQGRVNAPSPPTSIFGAGEAEVSTPGAHATKSSTPGAGAAEGSSPDAHATGIAVDMTRFLAIFEQVCQTVAYAHARDVIHRDLKPSNIMVGSFGEVQVMDWGLAKVLPRPGCVRPPSRPAAGETVVATARTQSDSDLSLAGTVLGTPAYMAPEQARGETTSIDRRVDVFALGSILTEILTGVPAYRGVSADEILAHAALGATYEALSRLDVCQADRELIALARDCLNISPNNRPSHAGVVAQRITDHQNGVRERLKSAELAKAVESARALEAQRTAEAALAKAAAESRARHLTGALAVTVCLTFALGAAFWRWTELEHLNQMREATERVNAALQAAIRLHGRARGEALRGLGAWADAVAAADKARDLLTPGVEPTLRHQVEELAIEVAAERRTAEAAASTAARDRKLFDRLADIRAAEADDGDGSITDLAYADAFREADLDFSGLPPSKAAAMIRSKTTRPLAVPAAALDNWAAIRRDSKSDRQGAAALSAIAREADPDPWRNRLRLALELSDRPQRLAALKELARTASIESVGPVGLDLLGRALRDASSLAEAEAVLRQTQERFPDDVWVNYDLADILETRSHRGEAIRYYTAARSLRPETAHELAHALADGGESEKAIAVFRDLIRLRRADARHFSCFGQLLKARGRPHEAEGVLATAVEICRQAIASKPNHAHSHFLLAFALGEQGKSKESVAEYRESIRLNPGYALAHDNLGAELLALGKIDEAIAEHRSAVRLQPDNAPAHLNLGWTLDSAGKLDGAIAEYRQALKIRPDYALAHDNLGWALQRQNKLPAAATEYRAAIRIKPDAANAHNNLGTLLLAQGKPAEAITEYRAAMRLDPTFAKPHYNLATLLGTQGKLDEAIEEYRAVIRIDPAHVLGHNDLAWTLLVHPDPSRRRPAEAIFLVRRAISLDPKNGYLYDTLALAEYRGGDWAAARSAAAQSTALQGPNAYDSFIEAMACFRLGATDEAIASFAKAVSLARKIEVADPELRRLWREAAAALGRPGPAPSFPASSELPADPFAPKQL